MTERDRDKSLGDDSGWLRQGLWQVSYDKHETELSSRSFADDSDTRLTLSLLPERARVVALMVIADRSTADIAARLGCSVSTARREVQGLCKWFEVP